MTATPDEPQDLTTEERRLWESAGARFDDDGVVERVEAAGRAALAALVGRSLTVAAVRELLSSPADLGVLYSFEHDGHTLFPRWQFHQGRPLPGIAVVTAALDPTLHPLTVDHWMTHPNLELAAAALNPVEWLAAEGDPQTVARLAADL